MVTRDANHDSSYLTPTSLASIDICTYQVQQPTDHNFQCNNSQSSTFTNVSTPSVSSICTSDSLSTLYLTTYTDWSLPLYFMDLQMLKVAYSLLIMNFIFPFFLSTEGRYVSRNGIPIIMGTSKSPSA